jgi:hypothetical protein
VGPAIAASFALSQLVVDVPIVLPELGRGLIVSWSWIAQLFFKYFVENAFPLLAIEFSLSSALILRQHVTAILGHRSYLFVFPWSRNHGFYVIEDAHEE